jgi:hypothetical protein
MPQPTLTITGDPRSFKSAADLTDETYATILAIFELEMSNTYGEDFLKTGLRAVQKVHSLARACGWGDLAASYLEEVAGQIYAGILREAAQNITIARREAPRG